MPSPRRTEHIGSGPKSDERRLAREAASLLEQYATKVAELRLELRSATGRGLASVKLPSGVWALIGSILDHVGAGRDVVVMERAVELTTQEAAGLLNVSRPFLIRLVEAGEIPHRKVGTHRRLRREHVEAYRARTRLEAEAALDALAKETQELGIDA